MDKTEKSSTLSKEIGLRIINRRKQLKLTQEQLAEKAELSHQFFSCVELGKKNMRAENIIKISKVLGLSTDYILTGKSNEIDLNNIVSLLKPLNEKQLKCIEEIIMQFILAVNSNKD